MLQLNWPHIHPHPSQDALDHAASLEADFDALDACVKLSVSKHHRLPSSLQTDIFTGILKALSDPEYPYEDSEADRTLIGALILKHITVEAAERARDRIPLRQYHDIRKSFQEFVTKLNAEGSQAHPKTTTGRDERGANNFTEPSPELEPTLVTRDSCSRQSEAVRPVALSNGDDTREGAGQADLSREKGRDTTPAAIAIDRPKKKGRKRKNRDGLRQTKEGDKASVAGGGGILEIMGNQPGVEEVRVHPDWIDSGVETDDGEDLLRMFKNIEAQCEHIRLQLQDFESEQLKGSAMLHVVDELMEEDDSGVDLMHADTLVNDPSDLALRPNDQADNQTRIEHNEQFQQGPETEQEVGDPDASSLITFNIENQATVNHLNDMGSDGILLRLSSSLDTMRSLGHDVPDSIRFTEAMLLDIGNVEVLAHAGSKEDMERLSRIRGWDLEFERSISAPAKSYAVETARISVDSLDMRTRKHKAKAIRELLEENSRVVVSLRCVDDIHNIRWCQGYKKESSLVIKFRTAQQADEVLRSAREAHKQRLRYTDPSSQIGKAEHEERAPEPQSQAAALNLPSPNSMPITPHNEGEVKVEKDVSLQNFGPVREHHPLRHTSMPASSQHEPHVKAEGSEHTQELGLVQNQPSELTSIQRRLDGLETAVKRLSSPQRHPRRRKRGADEMLTGGPSSYARKQTRRATQSRDNYPLRNRSHLPTDWNSSPYAVPRPGQGMPRQFFIRSL
ncbi:hypothetical protein HO133_006872 [Letharia lupina]|uniref:Uncharacterized protein n=1 Tax=Letharia lupina TaxID=560253 RepID=A0A8H6F7I4_9LECA|nr:uncharacterized protein HO133_006872 [Letharia lupina]KAF6217534.1 hypothetical protein HO133_006872 [Letharia lupina]